MKFKIKIRTILAYTIIIKIIMIMIYYHTTSIWPEPAAEVLATVSRPQQPAPASRTGHKHDWSDSNRPRFIQNLVHNNIIIIIYIYWYVYFVIYCKTIIINTVGSDSFDKIGMYGLSLALTPKSLQTVLSINYAITQYHTVV